MKIILVAGIPKSSKEQISVPLSKQFTSWYSSDIFSDILLS